MPFLPVNPLGYLTRAFEFTRVFLFKWTVNWRFIGEEWFLSPKFAATLATVNLSFLALFVATRWTAPSGLSVPAMVSTVFDPIPDRLQRQISTRVTPSFIMSSILGSMMIGLLCARTLHYQFYAYIAWSTPFLLWRAGLSPFAICVIWGAQELAWNVYPSTEVSSAIVVACLAIQVLGLWWGTRNDFVDVKA